MGLREGMSNRPCLKTCFMLHAGMLWKLVSVEFFIPFPHGFMLACGLFCTDSPNLIFQLKFIYKFGLQGVTTCKWIAWMTDLKRQIHLQLASIRWFLTSHTQLTTVVICLEHKRLNTALYFKFVCYLRNMAGIMPFFIYLFFYSPPHPWNLLMGFSHIVVPGERTEGFVAC